MVVISCPCPNLSCPCPNHDASLGNFCYMIALSNGNIFRVLAICAGNSPAQRPVTRSCDVCFDLSLNKHLSKQSWGWWFETQSHPLWRLCNEEILPQCQLAEGVVILYIIVYRKTLWKHFMFDWSKNGFLTTFHNFKHDYIKKFYWCFIIFH